MTTRTDPRTGLLPLALAAAFALGGCSLNPTYQRPDAPVPAKFPGSTDARAAGAEQLRWDAYFNDARLKKLIRLSLDNNRDLRVAVLNVEATRAAFQVQRADRFPTLGATFNAQRGTAATPPFPVVNGFTAGVAISAFEVDLFGRVRSLSEAASAQYLASEEGRKAAQLSLISTVATTWYAVWSDRWNLALAQQTLRARDQSFQLLKLKYDNGLLSELDLRSAQSLVDAARVQLAATDRQARQNLNALQLLVGAVPDEADLPAPPVLQIDKVDGVDTVVRIDTGGLWPVLGELPVGLPSDVLLSRPDVTQAEQLLLSANASVGAARAARFPRITLTATGGVSSRELDDLFSGKGTNVWNLSGGLLQPLLDAGRLSAAQDVAVARRDIAVAQYERTLQGAFREVADALAARETFTVQVDAQRSQADTEAARLRVAALRFKTGVASQIDLLDAQRSLFSAQQALIQTELGRQTAHIAVYRALGGGVE